MHTDCHCENEAEVLYNMYKKLGHLQDMEVFTPVCCKEGEAKMIISGKSLKLIYADGSTSEYTEQ